MMALPTFIIIGAQRSGTTSLHYALAQHPEVCMSKRKEPNFFMRAQDGSLPPWMSKENAARTVRTMNDYEALFDRAGPQHRAIGEISPVYLTGNVASRIAATLPDVKLIAVLRQPVEHAWSVLTTWLKRPPYLTELYDALEHDMQAPNGGPSLLDHGRYVDHLMPYFEHFPRSQIRILLFDRLEVDLLLDLQEFIGVTPIPSLTVERLNKSGIPMIRAPRLKRLARTVLPESIIRRLLPVAHRLQAATTLRVVPPISPMLRAMTEEIYGQSIADLERLTRLDLSAWRNGSQEPRMAVA